MCLYVLCFVLPFFGYISHVAMWLKIMQAMITLVMGSILEIYNSLRVFFNLVNNMIVLPK